MSKWIQWVLSIGLILLLGLFSVFWIYGGSILIKGSFFTTKRDVQIKNGSTTLAGTLWMPRSVKNPPAVVLIHGSGPSTRDDLNWYAKKLGLQGYAALTYDKRGVGKSNGTQDFWRYFSFDSLASDVLAGVKYLQKLNNIDASRIGLLGVSQGGWVAPLAAYKAQKDINFMILLSASVTTVSDDRLFERAERLKREGFTDGEIQQAKEMQLLDQEFTRDSTKHNDFRQLWEKNKTKRWFRRVYLSDEPMGPDHKWRRWYQDILDFDPIPLLKEISIPTVFIFGDPNLDRFSPVKQSIQNVISLPKQNKEYKILQYDGYDHNLYKNVFFGLTPNHASWEEPAFAWLIQMNKNEFN